MKAGSRQGGMTLVEVVLALGLFALLSMFVAKVMQSVLGLWQAGERRGQGDLVFHAALERLRGDLQALHNGARGWLILDDWEALPAQDNEPAWRLPRLRFLARGSALPGDDASGGGAVEVAWLLAPEKLETSRLCRLVRLAQPENAAASLADERTVRALLSSGQGVVVLDGVAWLQLELEDADGRRAAAAQVAAGQPFDFPAALHLRLERVAGNARTRPPVLDQDLSGSDIRLALRGTVPVEAAPFVLVDKEWLEVGGRPPRLQATARGARGSAPAAHARGAAVWIPESHVGVSILAGGGRRLSP